jgi:hypothetical protein
MSWLKRFNVFCTKIINASLIAIAKNYTGLQHLLLVDAMDDWLSDEFKLRAVLLSIYPSLPI